MAAPSQEYPTKQSDDFGTILGNSFKLIGESWNALVLNLVTFIVMYIAPILSVLAVMGIVLAAGAVSMQGDELQFNGLSAVAAVAGFVGLLGVTALFILTSIAGTIAQLASVRGKKIAPKEALTQSLPFFWKAVVLGVLETLIVIGGFLLLIIPGFLALFFLTLSWYILIDKNTTPQAAIRECYELTKKNWKVVLAYCLLLVIVSLVAYFPLFGGIVQIVLSIAYLCLPAILYTRMQKQNPVRHIDSNIKKNRQ